MEQEYFSIIYDKKPTQKKHIAYYEPDYFLDLNLDQVVRDIMVKCQDYDLTPYYYVIPESNTTIPYRQEILKDFSPALLDGILQFSDHMKIAAKYKEYSNLCEHPLQKQRWYVDNVMEYCEALHTLMAALNSSNVKSSGFKSLITYLEGILSSESFLFAERESQKIITEFQNLRYGLQIEQNKVTVSIEPETNDYCRELQSLLRKTDKVKNNMTNPLSGTFQLSILEQRILDILIKEVPEPFSKMEEFYMKTTDVADEVILRFENDVQFYVSFLLYKSNLELHGHSFTYPVFREDAFSILSGYDLALAGKNIYYGKPVITNDAHLMSPERFLIITGPNQGGKTTFARALGQIVYFSLIGLMVPCEMAELPMFSGITTHFSVEESPESGRGKLKEELVRLKTIQKNNKLRRFVVLNELFTTAATYDAFLMGEKVLDYFHSMDCLGVYVTHIKELAEEKGYAASFVAELGDNCTRTYKITKRAPDGSGYAESLAEKHGITYSRMKEVLSR